VDGSSHFQHRKKEQMACGRCHVITVRTLLSSELFLHARRRRSWQRRRQRRRAASRWRAARRVMRKGT
jgi:hypothetical protein